MPRYQYLRNRVTAADRPRVIGHLQRLREQLDRDIPDKDAGSNLLLATWNIRDLGKAGGGWGWGPRLPESHFYIAEILSRFDFVAVQEVNELDEWRKIMDILGPDWDFIATDVTDSSLGGNGERLLYLYDKRKVWFQNIAGEIVLPNSMLITEATEASKEALYRGKQFRRTPFQTAFQSGWFKFDICTVHLFYGDDSGPALQERIAEIDRIAGYLARRAKRSLEAGRALILLGDFNIVHPEHETMQALTRHGFVTPKTLAKPSNLDRTKYYDQIAFMTEPAVLEYIDRPTAQGQRANAGIFEIFESVFRNGEDAVADDMAEYEALLRKTKKGASGNLKAAFKDWRTWQISDHKPMWVRINSNGAAAYLDRLKAGG